MLNIKFKCAKALCATNAKRSNHSELYNVHNGSIYGASRNKNTLYHYSV